MYVCVHVMYYLNMILEQQMDMDTLLHYSKQSHSKKHNNVCMYVCMYICMYVCTEEHLDGALFESEASVLEHHVQVLLSIDVLLTHTGQPRPNGRMLCIR